MPLSSYQRAKLRRLATSPRVSERVKRAAEVALIHSHSPALCILCEAVGEAAHHAEGGYCADCDQYTVVSLLVLEGVL